MQKYQHIGELFACTQKVLAILFLLQIKLVVYSGTCSTLTLPK